MRPTGTEPESTLTNREALRVTRGEPRDMTRHAGNVAPATQDRIEREQPAEQHEWLADTRWCGQRPDPASCSELTHLANDGIDITAAPIL
jgi:hypothetical protein